MRAIIFFVVGVAHLAGCGSSRAPAASSAAPVPRPSAAAPSAPPTDPWISGDLAAQMDGAVTQPRDGGTLRVQVYSRLPSLNPVTHGDWWINRIVQGHVYEPLVALDPYDHPRYGHVPRLAERWEVSADGREYTFHLRRGVLWHDGKEMSSRDVVATFDKITDPATGAAHIRSYLDGLIDYVALDAHTVRFRFEDARFDRIDNVLVDVPIQPAHMLEAMSADQYADPAANPLHDTPMGTGPLRFVSWGDGVVSLARNPRYWGDAGHLDAIEFVYVGDEHEALAMALRGELDIVTRITTGRWVTMDGSLYRPGFYRSRVYDNNYAWIGWNQARPMFDDVRVRRALTMLIDRPRIIRETVDGLGIPTNCNFYHARPLCSELPAPLPFDPSRASELLEEAGWRDSDGDGLRDKNGVPFVFEFMVPSSSEQALSMGELIQEALRSAGIRMDIERVEWSRFTARLRDRDFEAVTLLWGSSGPRTDPTFIWHSESIRGGANYVGFSDDEADALLEEARREFDSERREDLFRQLNLILIEEQPYTMLYVKPVLTLISRKVGGARESLLGWQWSDLWLAAEAH